MKDLIILYKHSLVRAVCEVNRNLKNGVRPYLLEYEAPSIQRLSTKMKMPFGVCDDYVQIATAVLRSNGIPVAVDFTLQWAARTMGHSWNVIIPNLGKCIPFSGIGSDPGEPHMPDEKMAKVYRKTYASNPFIEQLLENNRIEDVPSSFRSPFFRDVTSEYVRSCDIAVDMDVPDDTFVYLAVFDNRKWEPVALSKAKGGKALFKDMGREVVYMPVLYKAGNAIPVNHPFLLTACGEIFLFIPDMQKIQTLILSRKYPVYAHVYEIANRIIGGEFQASEKADFQDAKTFHRIEKWGTTAEEVSIPSTGKAYRYWRFVNPKDRHCLIAEIVFIDRATHSPVRGTVIGTPGSWMNDSTKVKESAFDNNLLTSFDGAAGVNSWVGMDFGKPVDIEKIIYTPRGDGNTIELGDEYELFYWGNNQWNTLGRRIGEGVRLRYDNVPVGALFLLRDLTKGKEERIFSYVDGKQVFW